MIGLAMYVTGFIVVFPVALTLLLSNTVIFSGSENFLNNLSEFTYLLFFSILLATLWPITSIVFVCSLLGELDY